MSSHHKQQILQVILKTADGYLFVSKELSLVASNERCPSESYTLYCIIIQTELSYITRKAIMEICFRKMKLFQYTNSQATMKLCHKK